MTEPLVDFAASVRYDDLPEPAVDRLKQCILDFVGNAAFAGAEAESSGPFRQAILALAPQPGPATVIGDSRGYPYQYAALLNGAFAHSLDFDDTNLFGSLHPGAAVLPAALAVAERIDASGRAFLEGVATGYEVACRVGGALGLTAYDRGFHVTAIAGIFGAVAAGARLLGFNAARAANAHGLALSQAAGSMQYLENGAWNKRLHPGLAAHDALLALAFAEAGVLGAAAPIEGRYGLLTGYSNAGRPELLTEELGRRWILLDTAIKPYPSCRLTHGAIDAALELREKVAAKHRPRAHIALRLSPKSVQIVGERLERKIRPRNIVDAQFSVYFQAAAAWLDGQVNWQSYERLGNLALEALMSQMVVTADEAVPFAGADVTVSVEGAELHRRVEQPLGEPERPVSWAMLDTKFTALAGRVLGEARCRSLAANVRRLDQQHSMKRWVPLLRGETARSTNAK